MAIITLSSKLYNIKGGGLYPYNTLPNRNDYENNGKVTATSTSLERIIIVASRDWKTLLNSYLNRALAFQNHRVLLFTGPKACRLLIINS